MDEQLEHRILRLESALNALFWALPECVCVWMEKNRPDEWKELIAFHSEFVAEARRRQREQI